MQGKARVWIWIEIATSRIYIWPPKSLGGGQCKENTGSDNRLAGFCVFLVSGKENGKAERCSFGA